MKFKKILYSVLKEIKAGNKFNYNDYDITKEEFATVIEYATEKKYIKNALVSRGGQENKAHIVDIYSAKITVEGENYLEENSVLAKGYRGLKEIRDWLK